MLEDRINKEKNEERRHVLHFVRILRDVLLKALEHGREVTYETWWVPVEVDSGNLPDEDEQMKAVAGHKDGHTELSVTIFPKDEPKRKE